jgi:hypothetical protein
VLTKSIWPKLKSAFDFGPAAFAVRAALLAVLILTPASAYAQSPPPLSAPSAGPNASPAQPTANPSVMCGGPVVFADDFTTMNKAWGKRDVAAFVTANHAFGLAALPGRMNPRLYSASRFGDADICVNAFASQSHSPYDYGGIVFWADNIDNYYLLEVGEGGRFAVQRIENGKPSTVIVGPLDTSALKKGTNVANALEVSLSGSTAAIVINGQPTARFTGTPPAGGGYIGLAAGAQKSGITSWGFFHLVVAASTSVSPSRFLTPTYMLGANETAPSPCDGEILLFDDFRSLDPGWQPVNSTAALDNGAMTLSAATNSLNGRFNVKSNYSDFDACVLALPATEGAAGSVGLIFWATDTSNFYFLAIVGEKEYGLYRFAGGGSSTLVPWTPTNALNTGAGDWNELAVVTRGTQISVSINGKVLTTVQGAPPDGGGKIGLLVHAPPSGPAAWSFAQLRVTAAPLISNPSQAIPAPLPSPSPPAPAGAPGDVGAIPPL